MGTKELRFLFDVRNTLLDNDRVQADLSTVRNELELESQKGKSRSKTLWPRNLPKIPASTRV